MEQKKKEIEEVIALVQSAYLKLCKDASEGFSYFKKIVTRLSDTMSEILDNAPRIKELGVDFPTEIVLQQVQNMAEACEKSDVVLLADTLCYEIKETLLFYAEILQEMMKEHLEF